MIKNILEIKEDEIDDIHLGQLISNVNRYYSTFIEKKLSEHGVTRSQAYFLLSLNEKDHISQENICKLFNMTEGTVARTMKILENKKLIIREINPVDKRKKVIILTEEGKNTVKNIEQIDKILEKKLDENLSHEKVIELKTILKKIVETINDK